MRGRALAQAAPRRPGGQGPARRRAASMPLRSRRPPLPAVLAGSLPERLVARRAELDALRPDRSVGLEARDDLGFDPPAEEALDLRQQRPLIDADERDRVAV